MVVGIESFGKRGCGKRKCIGKNLVVVGKRMLVRELCGFVP